MKANKMVEQNNYNIPVILTLITPCGVNLTPEDHFHAQHKNHQHHSSEILRLCQAFYCDFISENVLQFHAQMTPVLSNMYWGPIGPRQINCIAATLKKILQLHINVRTGFRDPENMGKGTKIDFLSLILRKLWGIEYLAHLA